jgi:transcriptional regulator with XRE-family HTH domain
MAADVIKAFKRAFRASGKTAYRVALEAGVKHAVLQRFLKGERDVRAATFAKMCKALGLVLVKAEGEEGATDER